MRRIGKKTSANALGTLCVVALAAAAPAQATEYAPWHRQIMSSKAIQATANFGRGIRIAVIDTGTAITHKDLVGRSLKTVSSSMVRRRWDVDTDGHGTAVASVAVGSRNNVGVVGVASGATLVTIKITAGGSATSAAINGGLRRAATAGAKVINLSFGDNSWTTSTLYEKALHDALKVAARKAVIVVSAGNDGNFKPDDTAMHLLMRGVVGSGIMAGSVSSTNTDSSFSNAPGTWTWGRIKARDYFLNAPGENIRVATPNGGYTTMSGTSFAAPIIAGAAALVRARHPHLTPAQTVAILLSSAKDLGARGTDTLYGRGLLQVDRALRAIGTQRVASGASVAGPSTALSKTALAGGAAMGSLRAVRAAFANAVIFDDFGRDFAADFDGRIVARGATADLLQGLLQTDQERVIGADLGGMMLLVSADQEDPARRHLLSDTSTGPTTADPKGFALMWRQGDTDVTIGHGTRFAQDIQTPFLSTGANRGNPVFGLAEGSSFGKISHQVTPGLSFGARFSEATPELAALNLTGSAHAVAFEATYEPVPGLRLGLSPTFLSERSAVLGALSSGAMALSDGAETLAMTTTAAWTLGNGFTVAGHVTEGVTTLGAAPGSLFRSSEALRSRAYGASVEKVGLFDADDRINLSVNRPLRVYAGNALLDVPTGRTLGGAVTYQRTNVAMAPDGTQTDIEVVYGRTLGPGITSNLHFIVQDDAGHRDGVVEGALLGRVRMQF